MNKETQIQLPRVQSPNGENLRHSRVNEPTIASRSKFPLVALAEKYRKQYEEYKEERRRSQSFNDDDTKKPRDKSFQKSQSKGRFEKVSKGHMSVRTGEVKVDSKANSYRNGLPHKDKENYGQVSETVNNPQMVTKNVESEEKRYGPTRQPENAQDSQNVEQPQKVCNNTDCDSCNGTINGKR